MSTQVHTGCARLHARGAQIRDRADGFMPLFNVLIPRDRIGGFRSDPN
jgi:hypothetical protein